MHTYKQLCILVFIYSGKALILYLDNCQHHVCKLVGIWCKDSNQIHAKSGLHSEENVQMGIKKEVSHNKKEKTSQGKTNSEHANSDITSPADREIKVDLDKADKLVEQVQFKQ